MTKKEFVAQCHALEKNGWWLIDYEPERKYARYAKKQEFRVVQG
jgi:hypothetical protein